MLTMIPLTLWLKWTVIGTTIIAVYVYFSYVHRRQHKRTHGHPLAVATNNRYLRDISIILTIFGVIAITYVVKTDMLLHQYRHQIWELMQEPEPEPLPEPAEPAPATPPVDIDASLDALKEKYELLFVNHFILRKCNLHGEEEYNRLIRLYQQEAKPLSAPRNMEVNLLTAAEGSYAELYASTSCTTKQVRDLRVKMDRFMDNHTP